MTLKKINFRYSLILLTFSCMAIGKIQAQEQEKEEEGIKEMIQEFPFTETVYLQDQHEIQQIVYGHHSKNEGIANGLGYEIEYGITDWFQLSAGYSYNHWKKEQLSYNTGWFETGLKASLFNNAKNTAAIAFEAEFPVNKPEVETGEEFNPSYSPMLIYAIDFNKIQVHANAGAEIQKDQTEWNYNLAAVYGDGHLHPLLELNAVDEEDFNWYTGTGLIWNNEQGWEVILGARHGIDNNRWNAILDLIYEFTTGESE